MLHTGGLKVLLFVIGNTGYKTLSNHRTYR